MQKAFLFGGLALTAAIVLVFASVTYVLFNIDAVIKESVEQSASRAYKVPVTVADASMSLKSGDGTIVALRVPNPPGFTAPEAIHVPLIQISVDTTRPAGAAIAVGNVVLERPRVVLEIAGGKLNLPRLRDSARAWAARADNPDEDASKGQRLVVDQVLVKDGLVVLRADFLGDVEPEVPMPDTRIRDIGAEGGGALPAQVIAAVTETLIQGVERASRRLDLKAIAEQNGKQAPDIDLSAQLNE